MALFFEDNLAHSNSAAFLLESKFVKGGFLGNFADETALATAFTGSAQEDGTLIDMGLEQGSTAYIENYDSSGSGIYVVLVDASLADVEYDGTASSGWKNFREFIGAGDPNGNIDSVALLDQATAADTAVTSAGGLKGGVNAAGNTIQLGVNYGAASATENVILAATEDTTEYALSSLNTKSFLMDDNGTVKRITGEHLFYWATNLGGVTVDGGATATEINFNSAGSGLTSTENPSGVYTITADVVGILGGTGTTVTQSGGTFTINADVSNIIDGKGTKVTTQGTDTLVNLNYQTGATNFIATHQTVATGSQITALAGAALGSFDFLVNETSGNQVLRVGLDELGFASNFNNTFAAGFGVTIDDTDMANIEIGLEHGTNSFLRRVATSSNVTATVANIDSAWLAFHSTHDSAAVKVNFSDLPYIKGIEVDAIPLSDTDRRYLTMRENQANANTTTADNLEMDIDSLYYTPDGSGSGTLTTPNLIVNGNLQVQGNVTQYNATEVTFEDTVLQLSMPTDANGAVEASTNASASLLSGLEVVLTTDAAGAVSSKAEMIYRRSLDAWVFKNESTTGSYDNVKALTQAAVDTGISSSANTTVARQLAAIAKGTITVATGGISEDDPLTNGGSYKFTHNLDTTKVLVMVQKTYSGGSQLPAPVPIFVQYDATANDSVDLHFSSTTNGDEFEVIVLG